MAKHAQWQPRQVDDIGKGTDAVQTFLENGEPDPSRPIVPDKVLKAKSPILGYLEEDEISPSPACETACEIAHAPSPPEQGSPPILPGAYPIVGID